ncbi:MAG TPA: CHAT domain-containing protein [Thermoanaerobaculia bacterium]|nr:CHAT domain-containing protein [Thermoanaerobaculia bacterium]
MEPRLTEASNYHSCTISTEESDLVPDAKCGQRTRPARKERSSSQSEDVLRGGPAEEESQDAAIGDLLASGNPNEVNRAVQWLEKKTVAAPKDVQTWSDLSAAYLVRAQTVDSPRDLVRAYEAARRALEAGQRLEALFNRALALERLHLTGAAREAWTAYISQETDPKWKDEAESRKNSLSLAVDDWKEQRALLNQAALAGDTEKVRAIVNKNRQSAREYAELTLFGEWAKAVAAGSQEDASDKLRILKAVGEALAQTSGERLVQNSVAVIEETANEPSRWQDLVQGTRDFQDGYDQHKGGMRAVEKLSAAQDELVRANSPLAFRAAFFLASNDYKFQKYQSAIDQARELGRAIDEMPYGALRGQVHWVKGVAEATLGRMREAIEDYKKSIDAFQGLGESENTLNIQCRLGEVLMAGGRSNEGWRFIYWALRGTPKIRNNDQLAMVFKFAGDAALQNGMDEAALVFQQERVRLSHSINFLALVEALNSLARIQYHLGESEEAQKSLRKAESLIEKLDTKQRSRQKADIEMTRGLMMVTEDPARAAGLLSSALSFYEKEENAVFSLWTHLARGRAYRQAGDDARAEQDFKAALKYYDQMGENLDEEELRLALLEETDTLFDEMIDLQADRRDSLLAFAYADRARTRVLPGSASKLWTDDPGEKSRLLAAEPEPLAASEIQKRLPQGVTLVQFSVLEDRVLIWRLRPDGQGKQLFEQPVQRQDLEDLVARFRRFDPQTWERTSMTLFDLLVRPWLKDVPAKERIVLVPDKILHWVPFAALKDRSGGFLIETHPLALSPSATLYVNALERQGSERIDFSRGLVVGNPAIDRNVPGNESLLSLSEAEKEARKLAARTRSRLLVGKDATEAVFLNSAAKAEWIQFSGHAVIDPSNTLLSRLVLASGTDGDGFLTAREIYSVKLGATRLIVLAACDTGNEYVPGGEGVTSLARAFLAAGVPTVVASLWSVDDAATAKLSDEFHKKLLAGGDPVDALREAQLGMLRSENKKEQSPRAWAAFEVIGASAQGRP